MVIGDLESVEKIIPQQRPLGVTSWAAPADTAFWADRPVLTVYYYPLLERGSARLGRNKKPTWVNLGSEWKKEWGWGPKKTVFLACN